MMAADKRKRDVAIMGTNNSSIVSKRSAEKIYSDALLETQYLRYFVRKQQRRSPLINRGYWLRMKAVQYAVKSFLNEQVDGHRRIVVNLGCGYDPLPFEFQAVTSRTDGSHGTGQCALFVDVDYPDLIQRKSEIIRATPALHDKLHNIVHDTQSKIAIRSDEYMAVGMDLCDIQGLQDMFVQEHFDQCSILFTSEVAITYMNTDDADRLIAWTSTLADARFSLLEQIMPFGSSHPFARTMLAHFNRLSTDLKSVVTYSTLEGQIQRYKRNGWQSVASCDLWEFWQFIVTEDQKTLVENAEAFDEWEEFAIYGQHYFLLLASTRHNYVQDFAQALKYNRPRQYASDYTDKYEYTASHCEGISLERRFSAVSAITPSTIAIHGGVNNTTRSGTTIFLSTLEGSQNMALWNNKPSPRMCHTLTKLQDGSLLLIGGRASPDVSLVDCWLFQNQKWTRVHDLPRGRFRHSACAVNDDRVLVFGGRTSRNTFASECIIWSMLGGWQEAVDLGKYAPCARWAASASTLHVSNHSACGLLSGGLSANGCKMLDDLWQWTLRGSEVLYEQIVCRSEIQHFLRRFGAQMVSPNPDTALLLGGIQGGQPTSYNCRILDIDMKTRQHKLVRVEYPFNSKLPMLIGFGLVALDEKTVMVVGGGGVCFSFGSYWNHGAYQLSRSTKELRNWTMEKERSPDAIQYSTIDQHEIRDPGFPANVQVVPTFFINDNSSFEKEIQKSRPFIMRRISIGPCTELWSTTYLKEKVGLKRKVVAHETNSRMMNFQEKNFRYTTIRFSEFIDAAFGNSRKLYLRSLSNTAPTKRPAVLKEDFPEIAADFHVPEELSYITQNEFSSPLRISSADTGLWLHYDVHSNVLFSIRGRKRLLLFPPSDARYMRMSPGQSSSAIENIFENIPKQSNPVQCIMEPGDALYIPPLWLHAAIPLSPCIAVNIFFRNLPLQAYSDIGRDLYGNKDLKAYEKGRNFIAGLAQSLGERDIVARRVFRYFGQQILDDLGSTSRSYEQVDSSDTQQLKPLHIENRWTISFTKVLHEFKKLDGGTRTFYMERLAQELFDVV